MRKPFLFFVFLTVSFLTFSVPSARAQVIAAPAPALPEASTASMTKTTSGAVTSKSSLVPKIDSKFNDAILYSSVMDYSLAPELSEVAEKCRSGAADECYFSYKSFENAPDQKTAAAANLELSVLSLQRGLVKQAVKHIEKASALSPEDPYIELTKGWTLLCAGKYKKAREAYSNLFYLTADFEYVSSAKLGNALAYYLGGDKEKAAMELQYLYTSNPYTISFVSYLLGKITSEMNSARNMAPIFLQQALTHDGKNYAAAALLARLAEKDKNNLLAWQYYATLYSQDPDNAFLAQKIAQYTEDLGPKSIDYLFYLRLEQPIAHEMRTTPSPQVRMALYANREAKPVALRSFSLMPSGILKVTDDKLGSVLQVPSYVEKSVVFNPETSGVDFKDAKGHVEFSTRRPFTLTLANADRTFVVKNILSDNIFSADLSDKELKGALTVIPTPAGMLLVNAVPSEDLIPALLATQAQEVKEPAALRALAVVFRSALLELLQANQDKPYDLTDNDPYFKFKGINLVFSSLLDASKNSSSIQLKDTQLGYYANCGTLTASELKNTEQKPAYVFSPANVGKYVISNPPPDLFSKPQDPTLWSSIKWMFSYDAKDIANRIAYKQEIGKLRGLEPLKRTSTGRVLSMRFEGTKGTYVAQTPEEISFILSAGTLRSNLFDIVPLYKGKNIHTVLVRGYDTGNGVGLCLQGADGLAKHGANFKQIIKYYFPDARIVDTQTGIIN